ncbi:hypothetical protein MRB53_015883 [Persea americana]|uniref:Uncharacterized protein n=1 Tax=Persea americana TaxID=3435 RepID=A0ACC2M0F6_PERAE|nr:hypothetical protein MRB53_015883 [Persea americana]
MAEEHIVSSLNAETSSLSKQKPVITLNAFGLPVGDHSTKLASRCGELVRTIVPISIKDWRAVPKEKKDELWKHLQDEFIVPQSYKDKCLKSMSEMMRKVYTLSDISSMGWDFHTLEVFNGSIPFLVIAIFIGDSQKPLQVDYSSTWILNVGTLNQACVEI